MKKKHLLVVKSLKLLLKMQLKQKEWVVLKVFKIEEKTINEDSTKIRVLVLFNNDNNQSSNVFLAKKDGKWLVLLK
ncbi:hypothetical protein QMK15_01030 [Campylobacter jejuni]|nr:hypothetical protein QMK15_01030 [Campylobacter jejuni]